ncbi:MAG TPA: hypothetical protein DDZ76_01890 [Xanthomonadales bacterium]|nr:hypothetical protein [Xanthomonadales bacterium]
MKTWIRPAFIALLMPMLMVSFGLGLWNLIASTTLSAGIAWTGVILATGGFLAFFLRLFTRKQARTSANLPWLHAATVSGSILAVAGTLAGVPPLPALLALGPGLVGGLLYTFWYSRLPRAASAITVGAAMPSFELRTVEGATVSSHDYTDRPALWLFYRGNWCPLCMAQIDEVATRYRELAERGVEAILISPQPDTHTRSLAERFEAPMRFLIDAGNRAARAIGLAAPEGIPLGMQALGYDTETVLPTVVLTDAQGIVLWFDQTDNYRLRPEPDTFFAVLDRFGIVADRT